MATILGPRLPHFKVVLFSLLGKKKGRNILKQSEPDSIYERLIQSVHGNKANSKCTSLVAIGDVNANSIWLAV